MNERKILVVDDEAGIRELFTRTFATGGYSVRSAGDATEALEIMRANPAEVIFLDLNLPGMNGIELCRELRKNWPWTILIAVTGYASLFELLDCREAGFEDYFTKPVNLEDLLKAAEAAFAKVERWRSRD